MGFLDDMIGGGASGGDTQISTPDLSQDGKDLIQRAYERSKNPPKSDYNDQINTVQGMMSPGTMEDKATAEAISARLGRSFNDRTAQMRSKESLDTANKAFGANKDAFAYAQAGERVKRRNSEMVLNAYRANQEARAGALRSILGLGGMIAGAAIAGPGGAAAGAALLGGGPQSTDIGQGTAYDKFQNGSIGADMDLNKPAGPGAGLDFSGPTPNKGRGKHHLSEGDL